MNFDIVNKTICLVGKRASGKSRPGFRQASKAQGN
jgi:hypothetical protein